MIFFIKVVIGTIIWMFAHKLCKDYPFSNYGQELKPYDYFMTYAGIWMITIIILCVIFSLF